MIYRLLVDNGAGDEREFDVSLGVGLMLVHDRSPHAGVSLSRRLYLGNVLVAQRWSGAARSAGRCVRTHPAPDKDGAVAVARSCNILFSASGP